MLRDIVPARALGPCLRMSALMVRRTEFVHGDAPVRWRNHHEPYQSRPFCGRRRCLLRAV